ncbi:MAG: hypothetical protein ACPLKP_01740 [Microgenomates group bacterium]
MLLFNHPIKTGFSFGFTSGIITTLGLMTSLHSGTHSKLAVIGGIIGIAVADAFSDALGIHISEETEGKHSFGEIWQATLATFLAKFLFAIIFIFPILILKSLSQAIIINIFLGLFLIFIFNFLLAREKEKDQGKIILEHLITAILVVIISHLIGDWINIYFK